MPPTPGPPLSQEEVLRLHDRLLAQDPTAPADLAVAYHDRLIGWLSRTNPAIPAEFHIQAAGDAIVTLIKNPHQYAPDRRPLEDYLRMSAQGDLRNALRKEQKYRERRISLEAVEQSPDAGKYLGRDDDPSLRLRIAEQEEAVARSIPDSVRRGLTDAELRALDLLLQGERSYAVYAEVLGLAHLPVAERDLAVKRVKDRLKARMRRAGEK